MSQPQTKRMRSSMKELKTYTEEDVRKKIERECCKEFLHLSLRRSSQSGDRPEVYNAGIAMMKQFIDEEEDEKAIDDSVD